MGVSGSMEAPPEWRWTGHDGPHGSVQVEREGSKSCRVIDRRYGRMTRRQARCLMRGTA